MPVTAVQNDNNSKKMSYTKMAALGAVSGYALKYLLPMTKQEKYELAKIKNQAADIFVKENGKETLNSIIKSKRPTKAFVLGGVALAVWLTLINNIFKTLYSPVIAEESC